MVWLSRLWPGRRGLLGILLYSGNHNGSPTRLPLRPLVWISTACASRTRSKPAFASVVPTLEPDHGLARGRHTLLATALFVRPVACCWLERRYAGSTPGYARPIRRDSRTA